MKKINHIAIVMDRSGSMGPLANEALSGLNDELKTIAKNAKEFGQTTTISLVTFSTKVDEPRFLELEEEVTDYNCSGWTALNDAVGHTIQMLKGIEVAEGEDVAYLVLIVTDGMENSSREFSSEQIAAMINELEQRGNWTFTFMGAGANVFAQAATLGIKAGNSSAFAATKHGLLEKEIRTSGALTSYYAGRQYGSSQSSNFFAGG